MILQKVTLEKAKSLDSLETIYMMDSTKIDLNNLSNDMPKVPYFQVKENSDLLCGCYFFSRAIKYSI
jgi:hypothetical protein